MSSLEPDGPAPLLVGQRCNAAYERPLALYPAPPGCAGYRLWQHCQAALGARLFSQHDYLRTFRRINVLEEPGDTFGRREVSAGRVRDLRRLFRNRDLVSAVIFLGPAVAGVFGVRQPCPWFVWHPTHPYNWAVFPHPSGRNRYWNDPVRTAEAREFLADLIGSARRRAA